MSYLDDLIEIANRTEIVLITLCHLNHISLRLKTENCLYITVNFNKKKSIHQKIFNVERRLCI